MAFVFDSTRDLGQNINKSTSGEIGPGHYHNEGFLHKLAVESIYPKKRAPFNSNLSRFTTGKKPQNDSPGKLPLAP